MEVAHPISESAAAGLRADEAQEAKKAEAHIIIVAGKPHDPQETGADAVLRNSLAIGHSFFDGHSFCPTQVFRTLLISLSFSPTYAAAAWQ